MQSLKIRKKVYNFKKAIWDKYKNIIENQTKIINMNNKTQEEIDEEIKIWMETIIKAADESIPKNLFRKMAQYFLYTHYISEKPL